MTDKNVLPSRADIVVVGAGIAGSSIAYYLSSAGVDVVLLDRTGPAAEASGGNAGMIGESGGDPTHTLELQQKTVELYKQASRDFGDDFELVMDGRLKVAITEEEVRAYEALVKRQNGAGVEGQMLYGAELREFEPVLSSRALAGAWFPTDGKIHPVKASNAFHGAAVAAGALSFSKVNALSILTSSGSVTGVLTDKGEIAAERVVISTGAWTPQLLVSAGYAAPIFPGKGHMFAIAPIPGFTSRVIRAEKLGARSFANGEVYIGSEIEHVGYSKSVNETTIASYLEFMAALIPSIEGAKVLRSWGCIRPMSIDLLPIIGPVPGVNGLELNTGHGRSGMSLALASSRALADTILTGSSEISLKAYRPDRF